ncbi:hypothetical protein CPT_Sansa117 [Caulobacter phage Sansa]|uniref:Uncharacterized protein n=1 Tax=Caulobacter phage Sansa TaxID=1675600 RepID=A0A0K1LLL9_9CAUD|nr:hypothetical protein HOR07_gp002 [Caulobacter phage Sansa]YP_009785505.1 hypothetical protein HOR07_gp117 [Caulobacter phage Sansa]AKU43406.1 hypothetical protein CPT_Sansa2 [Caulobacter phage Sansa]AKU43521.1 hypothetical protein CPT_Sansa117 [Caulobacter phage Sansa]
MQAATIARAPSLAQLAYEADVAARPLNGDSRRTPRVSWAELSPIARWSWERSPAPRSWDHAHFPLAAIMSDGMDAARLGYTEAHNPYLTATRDVSGRDHPRPPGFEEKARAWAAGWRFTTAAKAVSQ